MKKFLILILILGGSVLSENLFEYIGYSAGEQDMPQQCGVFGYVLPGQIVNLRIKLSNTTDYTIENISGTLTILNDELVNGNPLVIFENTSDVWDDIDPTEANCNNNGFIFQVNRDLPCHYRLQFKLEMTTAQGNDTLFFSIPLGEMKDLPHPGSEDKRLTFDPEDSFSPAIALGPNEYGVIWKDDLGASGLYFSAYDRFFEQKVGPKFIGSFSYNNPDIIYNFATGKFIASFSNGTIHFAEITRDGKISIFDSNRSGYFPKITWNPYRAKIGILYKNGNDLYFGETENNYPFSVFTPIFIYHDVVDYDIAYDIANDKYFIAFSTYNYQQLKYDVYYTTYPLSGTYPEECNGGFCKIENARRPSVAVKVERGKAEYALVWEDPGEIKYCTQQVQDVYLKLLNAELNPIHPSYENILISSSYNDYGAHFPQVFWYEAGSRWIIAWVEDTCIKNPDGLYLDAIWLRTMNRNVPESQIELSEPVSSYALGVQSNDGGIEGEFDGERAYFVWADRRIDPRSGTREIFGNHIFFSHPYSFVPQENELSLSNPEFAYNDIQAISDGFNFLTSFIKKENEESHLCFSLLNEDLEISNNKKEIQIDIDGGVKNHNLLWDKENEEYVAIWHQSKPTIEKQKNAPEIIPDNNLQGLLSQIYVSENFTVAKVEVTVNITHPDDGDLTLSLIGPNNVEVLLSQKNGTGGANYMSTIFSDDGTIPITNGTPPFFGTFIPEQLLSTFSGISTQGSWTLKIVDDTAENTGTLNSWSLKFFINPCCGFKGRRIQPSGDFNGSPVNILDTGSDAIGKFKSALNSDGDRAGIIYINETQKKVMFFTYPNGTTTPVEVDSYANGFTDIDIAYNDSNNTWGLLWSRKAGKVFFRVLNDFGNFITNPVELDFPNGSAEVALVYNGTHYQAYYTYDYLMFKGWLINADGTIFSGPSINYNYGNNQLDAFFSGTETVVYWSKLGDEEALYSFKIFDSKGYPKTENIDIYSKYLNMSVGNLFSMTANKRKLLSAYGKEASSIGSLFYARTLDIFEEILTCSEIKNSPPTPIFNEPYYEVYYNCIGTCLTLDGSQSTTAENGKEDLGDSIVSYEWYLGATPVSNEKVINLTQDQMENAGIQLPGNYVVGLCVTDEDGSTICDFTDLFVKDGEPPSVQVITPNGGESWAYSESSENRKNHLIVWEGQDNFPPFSRVAIYYSTDEGASWACIADTSGTDCTSKGLTVEDTNYLWSMPTKEEAQAQGQVFPSAQCRIKVAVYDGNSNKAEDVSNSNFYIIQPTTTAIQTLILWNSQRIEAKYGESAKDSLSLKLIELSDHQKINGVVLDLSSVPAIQNAYTNWDAEPTNQTKANAVANEIRNYILNQVNNTYTNARYLILIGDDWQ
ncbi:MAG: proprotein convertase P-domain-containing protein, partial [Thermoanaerobaculia bacterium]